MILADIIPTVEQFAAFTNPATVSRYFHWGFLPNVALSVPMMMAFGSGKFCKMLMHAGAGANAEGAKNLFANDRVNVYASHFEKESVVEATARDYEAAAKEDYTAQVDGQEAGRKLDQPTLVLYSTQNLGVMADVPERASSTGGYTSYSGPYPAWVRSQTPPAPIRLARRSVPSPRSIRTQPRTPTRRPRARYFL